MSTKISIRIYARVANQSKNGSIPIYIRVTIKGNRIELSTGKYTTKDKWSVAAAKFKGTSEEARTINSYLDSLKNKVYETENYLLRNGIPINTETFKSKFLGIEEKPKMLLEVFEEHNVRMEMLIGVEYSNNTLKKYRTTKSHVAEFIQSKYRKNDLPLNSINFAFVNDFDFFLRTTKKCNNNSTVKYTRNFGKIIKACYAKDLIDKDPFVHYKETIHEVEIQPLDSEELNSMIQKHFAIERLELVRDIYVFSCYTGLAYVDIENLTNDKISHGIDGHKWIFTHRQKTNVPSNIPLLPIAEEILLKYKEHPKCMNSGKLLPILSNQKMNSYLKEIADVCGITKQLTFHTARHTFATTVTLANGVPMETVSKMLGHKSLRTTQHYAKILDKKVSDDMSMLRAKLHAPQDNKLKTVQKI